MNLSLPQANLTIGAVLVGLLGIVECFFGYRVFRIVLVVLGFLLGAALAITLVNPDQTILVILTGLFGGLLGAVLFYFLYVIGTFIAGLMFGAAVAATLAASFNLGIDATNIAIIVGAIVGGILGIIFVKYIIMLSTAFTGASQIIYAIAILLPGLGLIPPALDNSTPIWRTASPTSTLAILVLATFGFVVQLLSNRPVQAAVSINEPHPSI